MALDLTILDGHLDRVCGDNGDIPVTFNFKGIDYIGARSSPDVAQELEIGALAEKIDYVLFVRSHTFPSIDQIPTNQDFVTIGNMIYRIVTVKTSPDGNLLSFGMTFGQVNSNIRET